MPRKKKAEAKILTSEESLSQISKYAKLMAGSVVVELAKKMVSTDDRKIVWVLCDGKLTRDQLATKTEIPIRTVSYFIDECMNFGLLEEESGKGGHPNRVIDYVPQEWKKITRKKTKLPEQSEMSGENVQEQ